MNLEFYKKNHPLVVEALNNIAENGKMAHAYIVHCDNAELRKDFSLFVVKFFLCEDKQINKKPCGKCNSCLKIEKGLYPDLHILEPSSKTRRIKIGGTDEEGTLRWFQNEFSMSSMTAGGYKAGIIYDVECLVPQAQNAFLKTLEEPPKKTLFILATGSPSALLPTVISRCQTISLLTNKCSYKFEGTEELFEQLYFLMFAEGKTFAGVAGCAEQISALFASLYMQAENKVKSEWRERLEEAENLDSKTAKKYIKDTYTAAVEAEYRLSRKYFLDSIYTWFAQLYHLAIGVDYKLLANSEILSEKVKNQHLDEKRAFGMLSKAEEFVKSFNWNINETLAIQEFCLSFFE